MATGASTADLAVVLVDARKGVLTQTRRHSYIASLLGIRHVVLAVNKIDLVGYQPGRSSTRSSPTTGSSPRTLDFETIQPIPMSARFGDNVIVGSTSMPWYDGPTLLDYIETIADREDDEPSKPFRFPVQWVIRPNLDLPRFCRTDRVGHDRGRRYGHGGQVRPAAATGHGNRDRRWQAAAGRRRPGGHPGARQTRSTSRAATCWSILHAPPLCRRPVPGTCHLVRRQPMIPSRSYILRTESDSVIAHDHDAEASGQHQHLRARTRPSRCT